MIRLAASLLNDLVTAMPVGVRHALVEVVDGVPSSHAGHGQFVPVINDAAGGVSYWRSDGAASVTDISDGAGCVNAVRVSMPIALIGFVRRDQCDDMEGVLQAAVIQLRAALRPMRGAIAGAFGASIGGVSIGVDVVRTNEVKGFNVPSSLAVLSMRFVLSIDGSDACLVNACAPGDPICLLIQGLKWNRIERCLTPQQTEDAVESLCSGGGPCAPFTITINGPENEFAVIANPCGESFNVPVSNTEGDLVGGEVDGAWRIGDAIVFRDGVPFGSVAAEGNIDVPSDCAPCEVVAGMDGRDVADCIAEGERVIAFCNLIGKDEITASVIIVCADGAGKADGLRGTYQRKDSDGADIGSPGQINPGGSEDILCPDAAYQLKDSAGNNIGSAGAIVSNGSANIVAPDATAVVKNLNGTTLITEAILSNASENIIAPIPLKFGWDAGDADTTIWTVTDDEAGTYGTYTQTGTNGTVTYSKNGGSYTALSGSISLAVGDTITVRRTTTTNAGSTRWAP